MPFHVGTGCLSARISGSRIARIASSDTPPDMSVWEKIKEFFGHTRKSEALECIRKICHPPAGTTRDDVVNSFEQLRTLAYSGYGENIQSGRYGENHFCILDTDSREMLSVTLDDAGRYTVECQGYSETHNLTMDIEWGEECTEHAEGAYGTLQTSHTPATTTPQTVEDYKTIWLAWERASPPDEVTDRANVVQQLRDCLYRNSDTLNLVRLNISSLPDHLPLGIKHIQIKQLPLVSLPALPYGLRRLEVSDIPLTSLPTLPDSLNRLFINTISTLRSLPELPYELRRLGVSDTSLTSLPALPDSLNSLSINAIHTLTSLPELPDRLTSLGVSYTPLTSLPELPHGLMMLMVHDTSITSLPESITGLSSDANVELFSNPLSDRTLQALRDMTSTPDYSGPTIYFDMAGASVPRETRALHLAVTDWLITANGGEPTPEDRWQTFGQQDNAASFSSFLDRLSDTESCKKDSGFKTQISSWLALLAEDDELRAKTFAMAMDATSSCEDRVTLALHQMKSVQLVHNAEKGEFDKNLPGLVSVGREMFRLEILEQIAREKVKTLRFVDEIEVYLGYQNRLKELLGLTSVTEEMRFFGVSHITESDLQDAESKVKADENCRFSEWILQWEPLRSVLKRTEPERWEVLCEKKISAYNDMFRALSDTELKPSGLIGNPDAERTIGARAMESAEKVFLDGLRPLVDDVLGRYLEARWS
ncbi:E3 ubiquitin--protein ligase [Salmonella enterica]|nr:E3 ubiquitin--protein ligase [Salmonella enterica]